MHEPAISHCNGVAGLQSPATGDRPLATGFAVLVDSCASPPYEVRSIYP
jgi:hypothetical protein